MSTLTDLTDAMAVDVPEGTSGSMSVERFEVRADSLENLRLALEPGNRTCKPGTYTRLVEEGATPADRTIWMSDTTAERRDHLEAALAMRERGGSVLIGGLGLGMIVRCALLATPVERIEVLERSRDVIALVEPHYQAMAESVGKELRVHRVHDALGWQPPPRRRWDVVYFDIWPTLDDDNLPEMAALGRVYNRKRAGVFLAWGRDLLRAERRRQRAMAW